MWDGCLVSSTRRECWLAALLAEMSEATVMLLDWLEPSPSSTIVCRIKLTPRVTVLHEKYTPPNDGCVVFTK